MQPKEGYTLGILPPIDYRDVFSAQGNRLVRRFDSEVLWIEGWGKNSLRVRAAKMPAMPEDDWALTYPAENNAEIQIADDFAVITNGKITARVTAAGQVTFYNDKGEVLLDEYMRNRKDITAPNCSSLDIEAREFRGIAGGDYQLTVRFESDPNEKIYGMGQYQQALLNIKGCELELAHRDSQSSVPFMISDLGYGFLWNNPAVGRVTFGRNVTTWVASSSKKCDYWITCEDTPWEIERNYADVTGHVPMMPDFAMGFWQSKLRYQSQEELLNVAREYHRRGLPLAVIVADFFHWKHQGDWAFDEKYWPDIDGMVKELEEMGTKLMVSIWPTVESGSVNYYDLLNRGYLIRTERGMRVSMNFMHETIHYDATNPDAQKFVWDICKRNYFDHGIELFWLDEAEPEYGVYDFENYRYFLGSDLQIGNVYPREYIRGFYEGLKENGIENPISLTRCAWAGSQKYGSLVWSGDIHSSFQALREQLCAGLNMSLAGIPWWTTDIGGFHGGYTEHEDFRELFVRWFQFGTFCPVMRVHGDREPHRPGIGDGGGMMVAGADNEIWSYGEKAYPILTKFHALRYRMQPYIKRLMQEAHEFGTPVMRTLFFNFPEDKKAWDIEDQFMFGGDILVAPVLYAGQTSRKVYLPEGVRWVDFFDKSKVYEGGQIIEVDTPFDTIPVFVREGAELGFEL